MHPSETIVLMLFSARAHLFDIVLNRPKEIGRACFDNDADIAVPSLSFSHRQGRFSPQGNTVLYEDYESKSSISLHNGSLFRLPASAPKEKQLRILVCIGSSSYTWSSEALIGKEEIDIADTSLVLQRSDPDWKLRSASGNSISLPCASPLLVRHTILYRSEEMLWMGVPAAVTNGIDLLQIDIDKCTVSTAQGPRVLLEDIHTSVKDGSMVLIIGASGAGKTTFMHAVMGYEPAEGQILFHEKDLYKERDALRQEIGYVPQKDLLRDAMTVHETLNLAIQRKAPQCDAAVRTRQLLELFGLEKEEETLVRSLSGGQRKRVSCAVEFASRPSLFFLDEPDTGLDAVMSAGLMKHLRHIADLGTTVFVITHTPDRCRDLFDQVLVFAYSDQYNTGRLAYSGTIPDALRFFSVSSLDAIVTAVSRKEDGGMGEADRYIQEFAAERDAS